MKSCIKFISVCLAVAGLVTVTACNTAAGLGKDLQQGGHELQKAAQANNAHPND